MFGSKKLKSFFSSSLRTPKHLAIGLISIYSGLKIISYIRSRLHNRRLLSKAKKKLKSKLSQQFTFPQVSEETQQYILSLTVCELSQAIKSQKLSSVSVMSTYCQRAYNIGRSLNLTAEECFKEALLEAEKCDEETSKGHSRGPLHGVPISIKDHLEMLGYTSSVGLICKLDNPDTKTANIIELLKSQGAIPFVRSNVPQGIMWIECSNKIYGRAENPWDRSRIPGGSSGGESGLVSSRSSPLGIGSDIGGSIRVPCSFCGVYGFRVTPQRLSFHGVKTPDFGDSGGLDFVLYPSFGPIGRCVDDLILFMKTWLCPEMNIKDKTIVNLPFDCEVLDDKRKLKIGYFYDSGIYKAAECYVGAIDKCCERLRDKYEIVKFDVPNCKEIFITFFRLLNTCGNIPMLDAMQGEDPEDYYKVPIFMCDHPYLFSMIFALMRKIGWNRVVDILQTDINISAEDYVTLFRRLIRQIDETIHAWESAGLDALICPAVGVVAPEHGKSDILISLIFCSIWNVVRFPSGNVPVGLVKKNEAFYEDSYHDAFTECSKVAMEDSEGLPYGIQVVTLPYKDELALKVMKDVEDVFKFHSFPL
ncbi:hypothetical protein SteCoe_6558 [Stentor coeruleus]|uniref:Amidase domain-containing protein n=1 Tax=Stentor coeruleus TaxID=5963 RepID=A0A1R2CPQ2_9CILI|nr:hypothetical protein SteCoe_6558 [Stentor coeruleus]